MSSVYPVTNIRISSAGSGSSSGSGFVLKRKHGLSREDVANISDKQILVNSIDYAEKKSKTTLAGKITSALPTLFFAVVPALFGAMQKGPLSLKVKSAVSTALIFAGTDFLFNKFDNGMERVENAYPSLKESRQKNPLATSLMDFAAKGLLLTAALFGFSKGAGYIGNKFEPAVKKLSKSVKKASNKLDSTALAKKTANVSNKYECFMAKHPGLSKFAAKNSCLLPIGLVLGWMGLSGAVAHKANEEKVNFASKRAEDLLVLREIARNI